MSEQENTCPICGGVLRLEYVIEFVEARPHSMRVEPAASKPFRVCFGHYPEQQEPHDGKLDTIDDVAVSLKDGMYVKLEDKHDIFFLSASQALSLLTWLLQQQSTLKELVKEQEA